MIFAGFRVGVRVVNHPGIRQSWWAHKFGSVLKVIEFHTLIIDFYST